MASRVLLAAGGVALAVSLFVPWFDGVSGWEHWAWADIVLAVLAADLLGAAATPPHAVHRIAVAVLCALGIAVVLGHGFEPRIGSEDLFSVKAGPYVALAALAAGVIGALVPWPRRGGVVLLVAAAGGLVAALFANWGGETRYIVLFGSEDLVSGDGLNGFTRWAVLDVGLLVLAAALVFVASGRAPRLAIAACAVAAVAAGACVLVASRSTVWIGEGGGALGAALGPLAALLSLAAALAGLALLRRRAPAARAG